MVLTKCKQTSSLLLLLFQVHVRYTKNDAHVQSLFNMPTRIHRNQFLLFFELKVKMLRKMFCKISILVWPRPKTVRKQAVETSFTNLHIHIMILVDFSWTLVAKTQKKFKYIFRLPMFGLDTLLQGNETS